MTKETKIGLLVGLAFIILFAIILSEKGATNHAKAPSALTVVDSGVGYGSAMNDMGEPLRDAGRLPINSRLTGRVDPSPASSDFTPLVEEPVGQPIPGDDEAILPIPDSVVNRLNMPMLESQVASRQPAQSKSTSSAQQPSMSVNQAVAVALNASSGHNDAPADSASSKMAKARALDDPTASSSPRPHSSHNAIRLIAMHDVKPGENLGKIAAKYYGRATPTRIAALFDANRDKLSSMHSVRAGDRLKIPQLDAAQKIRFEPAPKFAPARWLAGTGKQHETQLRIPIPLDDHPQASTDQSTSSRHSGGEISASSGNTDRRTPQFVWYTVRKRDTLSRIAKRELGNEKLFGSIYKLNQDIIRNRNRIKPGMKIRLPIQTKSTMVSTNTMTVLGPNAD